MWRYSPHSLHFSLRYSQIKLWFDLSDFIFDSCLLLFLNTLFISFDFTSNSNHLFLFFPKQTHPKSTLISFSSHLSVTHRQRLPISCLWKYILESEWAIDLFWTTTREIYFIFLMEHQQTNPRSHTFVLSKSFTTLNDVTYFSSLPLSSFHSNSSTFELPLCLCNPFSGFLSFQKTSNRNIIFQWTKI